MVTVPLAMVKLPMIDVNEAGGLLKEESYPPDKVIENGLSAFGLSNKSVSTKSIAWSWMVLPLIALSYADWIVSKNTPGLVCIWEAVASMTVRT